MKWKYDPNLPRECCDCGKVCTVGELTPQKRLLDAPSFWVCPDCMDKPDGYAAIYQRTCLKRFDEAKEGAAQ